MNRRKYTPSLLSRDSIWKSDSNLLERLSTDRRYSYNRSQSVSSLSYNQNKLETSKLIESMRYHISHLKSELLHEKSINKNLKREAFLNIQNIREEESIKYQRLLSAAEFKLQQNFDIELQKECDYLKQSFTLEINLLKKNHDELLNCKKKQWLQEKDRIIMQNERSKINVKNELMEDINRIRKNYEKEILDLKGTIQSLNNELNMFKEKDFNRVEENRQVYELHQEELKKFKKEAEKSSKKQFSEIKKLNKYIEKLEKKPSHDKDTTAYEVEKVQYMLSPETKDFSLNMILEKSPYNNSEDFDIEGYMMEMPPILATKPHNDPERILHRKYIELCTLVRKLDGKNQQIAINNQELLNDLNELKKQHKPLEDKLTQLGKKNMDLSHLVRKYESKIKELQKDLSIKDEKLVHLQEVIQKKEKKMQHFKKIDNSKVKVEEFENLQRQFCEQLQIISELRHQIINKDMQIERISKQTKQLHLKEKRSLSLQSLDSLEVESDEEKLFFVNDKSELIENNSFLDENAEIKHQFAILSKEHLKLQHTCNLLQKQMVESMDPERVELNREALKTDLLVSQAVISGLEKRVEELDKNQTCLCKIQDNNENSEENIRNSEKDKDDLRYKLISAESDLVQNSLQLHMLKEELREALDHNELLEFQIAEMEHSFKLKKKQPLLSFIEEEKDDFYLDSVNDCNAVSVRIGLKEMQINRSGDLSVQEMKTLSQAMGLIDRGIKDINALKESDENLRVKMVEIVNMYNDAKLQLVSKEKELNKLLKEKSVAEEKELFTYELDISKKKCTFGLDKSEPLSEARLKIAELELKNDLLKTTISHMDDQQACLTAEEITLLQQKILQHQKCDEQLSVMKASYDELLKKLRKSEEKSEFVTSGKSICIPFKLSQEIEKLKEENKDLNKEVGLLRSKTNDVLFLALQTKNALNKEEQSTQTPVFEFLDFRSLEGSYVDVSENLTLLNESSVRISDKNTNIYAITHENINQTAQTDLLLSPVIIDDFYHTTPRTINSSLKTKCSYNQSTSTDFAAVKTTSSDFSNLPFMNDFFNQITPREMGNATAKSDLNQSTQTCMNEILVTKDALNQTSDMRSQIKTANFEQQTSFKDETSRRNSSSHIEDLKLLKNIVVEELMKVVVLSDVHCDPIVFLNDLGYPAELTGNSDTLSFESPFLNENQHLLDNKFIESVLKDYALTGKNKVVEKDIRDGVDNNQNTSDENAENKNVPELMHASLISKEEKEKTANLQWADIKKDYSSLSDFYLYLNESLKQQQSTPRNNPLASHRSNISSSSAFNCSIASQSSGFNSSNQTDSQTSGENLSDFKLNEKQFISLSSGSESLIRSLENNTPFSSPFFYSNARMGSKCSTCGVTPPNNRNMPAKISDLNSSTSTSTSTSNDFKVISDRFDQSAGDISETHFEIHDSFFINTMRFDAPLKAENLLGYEIGAKNEKLTEVQIKSDCLKENSECCKQDLFSPFNNMLFLNDQAYASSFNNHNKSQNSNKKDFLLMKKEIYDKDVEKPFSITNKEYGDVMALLDYGKVLELQSFKLNEKLQEDFSNVSNFDKSLFDTSIKSTKPKTFNFLPIKTSIENSDYIHSNLIVRDEDNIVKKDKNGLYETLGNFTLTNCYTNINSPQTPRCLAPPPPASVNNTLTPFCCPPAEMYVVGSSQNEKNSKESKSFQKKYSGVEEIILSCCPNSYSYLITSGTVSPNLKLDSQEVCTIKENSSSEDKFFFNTLRNELLSMDCLNSTIKNDKLHIGPDVLQEDKEKETNNRSSCLNDFNTSSFDSKNVETNLADISSSISSVNSSQNDTTSQYSVFQLDSKNDFNKFNNLPCPLLSKSCASTPLGDNKTISYKDDLEENTKLILPKISFVKSTQLEKSFISHESMHFCENINSFDPHLKRSRSVIPDDFDSIESIKKNRSRSHSPVQHNLSSTFVKKGFFSSKHNKTPTISINDNNKKFKKNMKDDWLASNTFLNKLDLKKREKNMNRNFPYYRQSILLSKSNSQKKDAKWNSYSDDLTLLRRRITFIDAEKQSLERQLKYKENVIQSMQEELKEENENIILVEKKDKEIHLKSETISQLTQILERTKKELQIKSVECQRQELTIKQLRDELKAVVLEKKEIETKHNSQQIYLSKLELCETQLAQLTAKYDECCIHNHELIERVKNLEIGEKEFIDLERNLIELQVQLRDMEDVELHRDELLQKLNFVKKQRDEFLEKGRIVEEERNEFVRSNKTLEQYIIEWKKKTAEFKRTNQALKDRILNLERDKKELEDRVLEIQTERSQALAALNKIEVERDDLYRQLREVTAERNAAEARLADLEDYLSDHDHLEEGFHSLRLKVSELTRQRDDAEMLIPSYKVKVQTLKKKLREKEDSIMQLTHDIKKLSIAIENQTYIDLKQIKSISNYADNTKYLGGKPRPQGRGIVNYFSDSPNKHLNPSTSGDSYEEVVLQPNDTYSDESYTEYSLRSLRQKPRQYIALFNYEPKRSRELRLTKGDYVEVYGDVDTDGFYYAEVNGARGLVPSVYVEDVIEDDSSVNIYRGDRSPRYQSHGTNVRERKFVALYDYDPFTMGTTDRPDLQLSLTKGDKITVIGDIDVDGYYTAIKKGARYLVPSNFVKEVSSQPHDHSHRHEQNHVHSNVVAKHSELPPNSHVSSANIGSSKIHKSSNNSQTFKGIIEVDEVVGPPYAPEDLKVHRVVTKQAVLLGWKLPVMNEYGQSNRCRVIGYRIWVNGKPKQDIKSATVTKALIEGLDLHGRVEFSIQTIGENGFCSEKCHFAITGALSTLTKENELLHQQNGDIYVALYDYDPFKSSPNPNPSLELKLSEGDLIKVTDKTRNDGFYFAEIRGNKGLVPSNFIERVNVSSSGHQIHEYDSQNRRVQFERGSTK
ncbi:uncharacterized protein LOC100199386 isoform X1 [Hydra vulgaris]|uniref:uncharacterized protein LOC100199386 isoform X1 n=1 Tax=Hydra vulgaris TaxID=6087 RepID=UPI001F5E8CCE|nr:uncharacterized protein LOC100199386 [Hydra vulgaris]